MNYLGKLWSQLVGDEDFAFEKRRAARQKAQTKANRRKKPNGRHRKAGKTKMWF